MRIVAREVLTGQAMAVELSGDIVTLSPGGRVVHESLYLSPGWVDLQVNGLAGYDVNAPGLQPEDVSQMAHRLWAEGVVAFCPTVVTAAPEHIERCLHMVALACDTLPEVRASVPGIHLEGPYLSPVEGTRGVHPAQYIHPPDWDEFCRWQEVAGGRIRLVTLAPEQPGSIDFIRRLVSTGVVVAIGHSQAGTRDIAAAAEAGATLSTHLGNGIAATIRRHPNPIWDQLADDRLFASAIFDGFHLPANVMRVFIRAKGVGRMVLVSDAVALARMPPGVYDSPVGGKVELHANGCLNLLGTEYLAGSASLMKDGFENALRLAGCSLADAVQMAAVNPLRVLPGAPPEGYTLFRWEAEQQRLTVLATLRAGRALYLSPELHQYQSDKEQGE
jgi:N-acetylglucosamine-6-phosphate deacetylase